MKAKLYQITVTTDIIHGWSTTIYEIFVSELGIAYNVASSNYMNSETLHVFKTDSDRYTPSNSILLMELEIDPKIVKILQNRLKDDKILTDHFENIMRDA